MMATSATMDELKFPDGVAVHIEHHDEDKRNIHFALHLEVWEEVAVWIEDFFLINFYNMCVHTSKGTSKFLKFKKYYRHPEKYGCEIVLNYHHNHPLKCTQALQARPVHYKTRQKLKELLMVHNVPDALDIIKLDLEMDYGADLYPIMCCDTALCPKPRFAYSLQKEILHDRYGSGDSPKDDLERVTLKLQEDGTAVRSEILGNNVVIALVTPLMSRVHTLPESGEIVFMDASGGMDRFQCRVFLLMTHSIAGGLPLGAIITTTESTEVIKLGLRLLGEILPQDAFSGRGAEGPAVFMTDDSEAERQALSSTYPHASLLLCLFHILQAFWRFLWQKSSGVAHEDRPTIFRLFKVLIDIVVEIVMSQQEYQYLRVRYDAWGLLEALVYAKTQEELENSFNLFLQHELVQKYPKVEEHTEAVWAKRTAWALALRRELKIRGHNTNNMVEAAFRVLKDTVLCRVKAYNIVQLACFLSQSFSKYYSRKIIDVVNRKHASPGFRTFSNQQPVITKEAITMQPNSQLYVVPSQEDKTSYLVDMELGSCSCAVGLNGKPCKHQHAVYFHFQCSKERFEPISENDKVRLFQVATGTSNVPEGFFMPLKAGGSSNASATSSSVSATSETVPESRTSLQTGDVVMEENAAATMAYGSFEDISRQLDNFIATVKDKLLANPETFAHPTTSFLQKLPMLYKSDTAFASALATFAAEGNSKRPGRKIKVQPTAIARRKSVYKGCKSLATSGRPLKALTAASASKTGLKGFNSLCLPRRQTKSKHRLNYCVKKNVSLGKTHSAK